MASIQLNFNHQNAHYNLPLSIEVPEPASDCSPLQNDAFHASAYRAQVIYNAIQALEKALEQADDEAAGYYAEPLPLVEG